MNLNHKYKRYPLIGTAIVLNINVHVREFISERQPLIRDNIKYIFTVHAGKICVFCIEGAIFGVGVL